MERLTEKAKDCFGYRLKDGSDAEVGFFKDYNAFYSHMMMVKALGEYEDLEDLIGIPMKDLAEILRQNIPEDCKHPHKAVVLTDDDVDRWHVYKNAEEQGLLLRLPCKVGDTVYVDSSALPIEDMERYEDVDNPIPSYFPSRVVSFRFAKRNWVKVSVKTKWLYEWVDDETGPDCDYREYEKSISFPLSMFDKKVFLTKEQAEEKLKELRGEQNDRE